MCTQGYEQDWLGERRKVEQKRQSGGNRGQDFFSILMFCENRRSSEIEIWTITCSCQHDEFCEYKICCLLSWVLLFEACALCTDELFTWKSLACTRHSVNYKCRCAEKVHTEVHMGTYGGIVETTSYINIRNLSYSLDHPKLVAELSFDTGHSSLIDSLLLPSLMARWLVNGVSCCEMSFKLQDLSLLFSFFLSFSLCLSYPSFVFSLPFPFIFPQCHCLAKWLRMFALKMVIWAERAEGECSTKMERNCCKNVCVPPIENRWKNEAGAWRAATLGVKKG